MADRTFEDRARELEQRADRIEARLAQVIASLVATSGALQPAVLDPPTDT